jgi:N-acetylmuramoyl-L-alanine amidase
VKVLAALSVMALPLLEKTAYADTFSSQVTVTTANLNVREAAGISSKIIGMVHQGDSFDIIQSMNNWDQIKLLSNQTGWIYNAYTTPIKSIGATIAAKVLNVRESPSLASPVVGILNLGTKITVQEEKAGWAKMVSASGVQGWVYEYYITKEAPRKTPAQVSTDSSHANDNKSLSQSASLSSSSSNQVTTQSMKTEFVQNSQALLTGRTIVLDPGHGGIDNGTTSIVGTHEKTLTLATAVVVAQKLENAGANVIMTRTDDTYIPLPQRAELSKQYHADAFISFHYNWSNDPSVNGLTDFYYQKARDTSLASDILEEVIKTTGLNNVGTRFDNLSVLRNNSQPSTLIELGFLSNKQDDSIVETTSYRDQVAEGVYRGLLKYWGL